jgi:hypothetical protein
MTMEWQFSSAPPTRQTRRLAFAVGCALLLGSVSVAFMVSGLIVGWAGFWVAATLLWLAARLANPRFRANRLAQSAGVVVLALVILEAGAEGILLAGGRAGPVMATIDRPDDRYSLTELRSRARLPLPDDAQSLRTYDDRNWAGDGRLYIRFATSNPGAQQFVSELGENATLVYSVRGPRRDWWALPQSTAFRRVTGDGVILTYLQPRADGLVDVFVVR